MQTLTKILASLFVLIAMASEPASAQRPIFASQNVAVTGGSGTWSLVQFKYFDAAGGGTGGSTCGSTDTGCTVNITAPGAGHLLVATYLHDSSTNNTTTPTGGQTWTHCPAGAQVGNSTDGFADCWYVLSATATGQTTVTCNQSATSTNYHSCGLYEYAWTGSSISIDTSGGTVRASCTSCAAVSLTLGGTDVVIQTAISIVAATGVTALSGSTFTSPQQFYSNTGNAGGINLTSFTAPNWTMSPSSATTVMGVAFKGN